MLPFSLFLFLRSLSLRSIVAALFAWGVCVSVRSLVCLSACVCVLVSALHWCVRVCAEVSAFRGEGGNGEMSLLGVSCQVPETVVGAVRDCSVGYAASFASIICS